MLKSDILGMKLKNPLFLAAGILGTTASGMKMVANAGAGGIVTKSFSLEANDGYDNPTIVKSMIRSYKKPIDYINRSVNR